ncbi:decaprenyl-phosphate phosphoribosyltransferase [Ferrovibrio terrae]|uniref:Decaprenyl-phosphate phosphoribosyltransferase n=2 Tax=Ferrovibrio terrae TaxID=2594003 RepID=A0A516H7P0_9PROT|nr:decaprenyl-phosphate phosphoribosyltransferase [Ferrovibrio terrae]
MRPRQWIKNGFVLAPLIFSGQFLQPDAIMQACVAALLFCLGSSAAYILNDLHDVAHDRLHQEKSTSRPLAEGSVTPAQAKTLLAALYVILFVASWLLAPFVGLLIGGYLAINLAYTFVLKQQPVLDIFTIATGFVLRVYTGAVVLDVPLSSWMFITTLCLALYLAAMKRRQELLQNGAGARAALSRYSPALIDRYAKMSALAAQLSYSAFVITAKPQLGMTIPLVLFGLFRYWYVAEKLKGGESPAEALLGDWLLLLVAVLWIAACIWGLWPLPN